MQLSRVDTSAPRAEHQGMASVATHALSYNSEFLTWNSLLTMNSNLSAMQVAI